MSQDIRPTSLDHVALWVDQRAPLASFLCDHLGMHVIEETDTFTLAGVDAKLGKLTLFDAEGPRERGALERIALRVGEVARRLRARRGRRGQLRGARAGCRSRSSSAAGVDFDLDHVVLRLPDRDAALAELAGMGFERRDGALAVSDRELLVVDGGAPEGERPLLNHIALLVDSAAEVQRDAEVRGVEIDDVKDAPNTLAVFLRGPCRGPDRVRRAQAGLRPGLSDGRPGGRRGRHGRPRGGGRGASARRCAGRAREARAPRWLDAAVERRRLAPPRARALRGRMSRRRPGAPAAPVRAPRRGPALARVARRAGARARHRQRR